MASISSGAHNVSASSGPPNPAILSVNSDSAEWGLDKAKKGSIFGLEVIEVSGGTVDFKFVELPLCDECKAMIHITQ